MTKTIPPSQVSVVVLGSGTPEATQGRSGPGLAIVVGANSYLIDAGPAIVRQLGAARERGLIQLSPENLRRLFVTHLHSDHTTGLADLILNPWVRGRVSPLEIWGPRGVTSMAKHLEAAYREDIDLRLTGLEPSNQSGFQVVSTEITAGIVYRDKAVSVEAFNVPHGSWASAFGFKFVTPSKTIVISGDTSPSKSVERAASGCDILFHEVYSAAGLNSRSKEWRKYFREFHTSTIELAKIATAAKPKLLVLYHQFHWGVSDTQLVQEVMDLYDGAVVSANDLDIFE